TLPLLGPAFVAAIAYVDPGNFATNIAGGAAHGYLLLWVILLANLIGMLVQNLSAKVGIATGRNLPELCREHLPAPASWSLWVQAELIAMATDLAEFIGAALALNLLFGVPLFVAGLMTAVVAFAILGLQQRGYRKFELAIAGLMGVILLGFVYDALHIDGNASAIASGFIPAFHDKGLSHVNTIQGAHSHFQTLLGGGAALAFALALLASGFASSSVGTYAGQVVMQGFIRRSVPIALRRLVTMAPALVVLAVG